MKFSPPRKKSKYRLILSSAVTQRVLTRPSAVLVRSESESSPYSFEIDGGLFQDEVCQPKSRSVEGGRLADRVRGQSRLRPLWLWLWAVWLRSPRPIPVIPICTNYEPIQSHFQWHFKKQTKTHQHVRDACNNKYIVPFRNECYYFGEAGEGSTSNCTPQDYLLERRRRDLSDWSQDKILPESLHIT